MKQKLILSNLSETRKENLKFLRNDTLKEILKDDNQIKKLAHGKLDKNKFKYIELLLNSPIRTSEKYYKLKNNQYFTATKT